MPAVANPPSEDFPAVFEYRNSCGGSGEPLGAVVRKHLDNVLHLYGAVVLKGLPLEEPADFAKLMNETEHELMDYVGGVTTRPNVAEKVTPASTEGSDVSMESHNDDPYWGRPPTRLVLYCKEPPRTGGQAFLTDGRGVLRQLRDEFPSFVEELKNRSLRYVHFYPDADTFNGPKINTWQEAYEKNCAMASACNLTGVAEDEMQRNGNGWTWEPQGLRKWELSDAIKTHPITKEETWTNQLTAMHCSVFDNHPGYPGFRREPSQRAEPCGMHGAMPYHTTWGDGSPFPGWVLHAVRRAQWNHTVSFEYAPGDVVVIDNYLAMHGRFSFTGNRELFITMVGPGGHAEN